MEKVKRTIKCYTYTFGNVRLEENGETSEEELTTINVFERLTAQRIKQLCEETGGQLLRTSEKRYLAEVPTEDFLQIAKVTEVE